MSSEREESGFKNIPRDHEKGTCCICHLCNRIVCFGRRNARHSPEKYDRIDSDYRFEKKIVKFHVNVNDNSTDCKGKEGLKSGETFPYKENKEGLSESSVNYNILPDFIPRRESPTTERVFLQKPTSALQIGLTVKQQYEPNPPRVPHLVCGPGDSLWLSSGKSRILQKVKLDGIFVEEKLRLKKIRVHGLAVTPSNDILIVTKDTRLKQINGTTGELEYSKYNVAPSVPIAVHVTQSGHVLVGATDAGSKFPSTGRRVVLGFNTEGDTETSYEYDKYNKQLFTYPCRITSTKDTIGVVDRVTDDKKGQVIILGKDGTVKHKYIGQRKPFRPVYIVTTSMDNILIADRDNHELHILDSVGNLNGCLNLRNYGITYPLSLAYNTEGQLYMCSARSTTYPPKHAQIYQMTRSGC